MSITGFGHDGPEASRAGYDQIAQGEGGLMSITGTTQPTKVGVPIADLIAGMNGAFGVVAALHERTRTGRGRVVRTSLLAGMVGVHAFQGTKWTVAGEVPGLSGDHHPSIAPYGMFATGTAPIQIACGSEGLWRALCTALEWDPAEDGFATNPERVENRDSLIEKLESRFASDDAEHWLSLLSDAGVPSGKVRSMDDVYSWEQVLSQGLKLSVDHPTLGAIDLPGSPLRFDDNPFSGGRSVPRRSPDARPAQRVDPGVAGLSRVVSRDWQAWHRDYDDPTSSLSRRLEVVRAQLWSLLERCRRPGPAAQPVRRRRSGHVAGARRVCGRRVRRAGRARPGAGRGRPHLRGVTRAPGVEVRTADAGSTSCAEGAVPADVVMACGIFGNVTDADVARTVSTLPSLLAEGGHVIWTRGRRVPHDPTEVMDRRPERDGPWPVRRRRFRGGRLRASGRRVVPRRRRPLAAPGAPYKPDVRMFDFV